MNRHDDTKPLTFFLQVISLGFANKVINSLNQILILAEFLAVCLMIW